MSMMYRYEFEISPVKPEETGALLDKIPYPLDFNDHYKDKFIVGGESQMFGGVLPEERHEEICKLLSDKKVVTKWRCMEFDEWDDVCGNDEDDEDEDDNPDGPR